MVYKRVRGWTSGRSLPYKNFLSNPPPPGFESPQDKNFEKNNCTNTWSKIFITSRRLVFIKQMALFGDDLIRKYPAMQKFIQLLVLFFYFFFPFIFHFLREVASLKLNWKVCDAIPGTLYDVSEENATINANNRFTERFNFELAFNLPLSKLFKAYLSVTLA